MQDIIQGIAYKNKLPRKGAWSRDSFVLPSMFIKDDDRSHLGRILQRIFYQCHRRRIFYLAES
jgi:hypothetical protein